MTRDPAALHEHAQSIYPADRYLQREWLRAVDVVRTTAQGWGLDVPAQRLPQPEPEPLHEVRTVPAAGSAGGES